jgi:arsenite methyltransferase
VIDSGADLNAYASVDGQSACCSPSMTVGECCDQPGDGSDCCDKPKVESLPLVSCCADGATELHRRLSDLLSRYDVNDYAASVKVFALKP